MIIPSSVVLRISERWELDTITGCHNWTGGKTPKGYGCIAVTVNGIRKNQSVHRVAWQIAFGEIPTGMQVLHHCDNPGCINLDHLFIGTNADNVSDKVKKGRQAKGHILKKRLTDAQVISIFTDRRRTIEIAKEHGIHQTLVYEIKNRQIWGWLTNGLTPVKRNWAHDPAFPNELIIAINSALGSQREIANRFGVCQNTVSRIKRGLIKACKISTSTFN